MQANTEDARLHGGQVDAVIGQHVIEEIHLDQQRCAADKLDQQGHRPRQPDLAAAPAYGQEQAEDNGDQKAHQGDT
ncbi:hypothetical protein D3C77_474520 [compost metagenome]